MAKVKDTDQFLVNRNGQSYQIEYENLMAKVQDTDLLLVNRDEKSYKVTGLELKNSTKVEAPILTDVTLIEQTPDADPRFTDQEFLTQVVLDKDGFPASEKKIEAHVDGRITKTYNFNEPVESTITTTGPVYSDSIAPGPGRGFNPSYPKTNAFDSSNTNFLYSDAVSNDPNVEIWRLTITQEIADLWNTSTSVLFHQLEPTAASASPEGCSIYRGAISSGNMLGSVAAGNSSAINLYVSGRITNWTPGEYLSVGSYLTNSSWGRCYGFTTFSEATGVEKWMLDSEVGAGLVFPSTADMAPLAEGDAIQQISGFDEPLESVSADQLALTFAENTNMNSLGVGSTVSQIRDFNELLESSSTVPGGWNGATAAEQNGWNRVTYGELPNGTKRFVAVAGSGTNKVMYSEDAITWLPATAVEDNFWSSVAYGGGKFVAVASNGTNQIMHSSDGISWTGVVPPANNSWQNIAFGNGTFVATSITGTRRAMYSTDGGVTWTLSLDDVGNTTWRGLTYGNGKFVAVADGGNSNINRAAYSTDGANWTYSAIDVALAWWTITYGDGKYVAISHNGVDRVAYSTDLNTWTYANIPSQEDSSGKWNGITYGDGKFVAIAQNQSRRVAYSEDAITWNLAGGGAELNSWSDITYGDGKFVAVAYNGDKRVLWSEVVTDAITSLTFANGTDMSALKIGATVNQADIEVNEAIESSTAIPVSNTTPLSQTTVSVTNPQNIFDGNLSTLATIAPQTSGTVFDVVSDGGFTIPEDRIVYLRCGSAGNTATLQIQFNDETGSIIGSWVAFNLLSGAPAEEYYPVTIPEGSDKLGSVIFHTPGSDSVALYGLKINNNYLVETQVISRTVDLNFPAGTDMSALAVDDVVNQANQNTPGEIWSNRLSSDSITLINPERAFNGDEGNGTTAQYQYTGITWKVGYNFCGKTIKIKTSHENTLYYFTFQRKPYGTGSVSPSVTSDANGYVSYDTSQLTPEYCDNFTITINEPTKILGVNAIYMDDVIVLDGQALPLTVTNTGTVNTVTGTTVNVKSYENYIWTNSDNVIGPATKIEGIVESVAGTTATITPSTANWINGDPVNGTSTTTGIVDGISDNTVSLSSRDGDWEVGKAVTGVSETATATVSNIDSTTVGISDSAGTWKTGLSVTGPEKTITTDNARLYCAFDSNGNISDLLNNPQDPPYITTAENPSLMLTFPSTFPTGNTPDDELPNGVTLTVDVTASNVVATSGPLSATVQPKGDAPPPPPPVTDDNRVGLITRYGGNGGVVTIDMDMPLPDTGGMVWIKQIYSSNVAEKYDHVVYDTQSDNQTESDTLIIPGSHLRVNNDAVATPEGSNVGTMGLVSFDKGTTTAKLGSLDYTNKAGNTFVAYSFLKKPGFFDIVNYTGNMNGTHTIPHNLGEVPGFIIVKCRSAAGGWWIYHSELGPNQAARMDSTDYMVPGFTGWGSTNPTETEFTVGGFAGTNGGGEEFVAYLFGNNAEVKAGSYIGNGNTDGPIVNCGFKPQWILIKRMSGDNFGSGWRVLDASNGFSSSTGVNDGTYLASNTTDHSIQDKTVVVNETGFQVADSGSNLNSGGDFFSYVAIAEPDPITVADEVLSSVTTLYDGNSNGTQSIVSGADLENNDGLVWIKNRDRGIDNALFDTIRDTEQMLRSDKSQAETTELFSITKFNSDGFDVGNSLYVNNQTDKLVAWTFPQAPGFFDVVTYTGTGTSQTIPHNLGSKPGVLMIKNYSNAGSWFVYVKRNTTTSGPDKTWFYTTFLLETTDGNSSARNNYLEGEPSTTTFTVGSAALNNIGDNYVAYLFDGDNPGVIKSGTGQLVSGTARVVTGFKPQWILVKADATGDWMIIDAKRGNDATLAPNSIGVESNSATSVFHSDGFTINFGSSQSFVYLAIAAAPPEPLPTETQQALEGLTTLAIAQDDQPMEIVNGINMGFYGGMIWFKSRQNGTGIQGWHRLMDIMRDANYYLYTNNDNAPSQSATGTGNAFTSNGFYWASDNNAHSSINGNMVSWCFARTPGFFDVVTYNSTSGFTVVPHTLGVKPGFIITKKISGTGNWYCYHSALGEGQYINLNQASPPNSYDSWRVNADNFMVNTDGFGTGNHVAYVFAEDTANVVKCGSVFTDSYEELDFVPQWILIKHINSTGSWAIYDSKRGWNANLTPNFSDIESSLPIDVNGSGFSIPSGAWGAGIQFLYVAIAEPPATTSQTSAEFSESLLKFMTYNNRKEVNCGRVAQENRNELQTSLLEAGYTAEEVAEAYDLTDDSDSSGGGY